MPKANFLYVLLPCELPHLQETVKKVKGNDETPSTCTCRKWTIQDIRETVHNGESGGQSALLMCNLTTIYGRNVSSGTEQNVHEDDKYSQKDIYVSSNVK